MIRRVKVDGTGSMATCPGAYGSGREDGVDPDIRADVDKKIALAEQVEEESAVFKFMQAGVDVLGRSGHAGGDDKLGLVDEWHKDIARDEPASDLPSEPTRERRRPGVYVEGMLENITKCR